MVEYKPLATNIQPFGLIFLLDFIAACFCRIFRHWVIKTGLCWVKRDAQLMLGFAVFNILVMFMLGWQLFSVSTVTSNPANNRLVEMDSAERLLFFIKTIPQLLGEELITILPFLAILSVCTQYLGCGRKLAILLSSVLFGMAHLPTYHWNWIQCLLVIGSARLVLTLPWIMTKNIWMSTGAHILNDWVLFALSLLGANLVASA